MIDEVHARTPVLPNFMGISGVFAWYNRYDRKSSEKRNDGAVE